MLAGEEKRRREDAGGEFRKELLLEVLFPLETLFVGKKELIGRGLTRPDDLLQGLVFL